MNKLKDGKEYETYIHNIIKDKYKNCYLWEDIPCNILEARFYKDTKICDDIGCDIIGINHDNTIDYIQCKNYSTTGEDNIITIYDLSGFYNFIAENNIINSIVYYSGKLSQQIKCRKNKIRYVNLPMIKNNKILDFNPREYQIEAYNKLKDVNRSILSMPCGTGKTFVSFLLSLDYKNIFILTPLISTTEQIFIHYKNYYSSDKDIIFTLINCKAERNISNIKLGNKNIIASTYDSCDIIIKLLNNTNTEDNLIIIDEFHNISCDMIINEKNKMNQILTSKNKILFISATPLEIDIMPNLKQSPKFSETTVPKIPFSEKLLGEGKMNYVHLPTETANLLRSERLDIMPNLEQNSKFSETTVPKTPFSEKLLGEGKMNYVHLPTETALYTNIFGEIKYELEWKTAIDNKYICDYNFYYPNNDKIIDTIDNLKLDQTLIEKTILINKAYFLLETIKLTNVKKCITYLKTINEMEQFIKILKTINIYFNLNIKVYEINYNTNKKKRQDFLTKFKCDNTSINILCNVHILDEGIDIPECDSIYLTHPNNNPVNIIQRISRANRLDNNNINKIAKIFIWSKDEVRLEQVMKNITKIINIKYGIENNEFVNKKIVNIVNIIDNNKIKEFWKKYPTVSIDFIDDFYKIYKFNESNNNDFIINIVEIAKWFKMKKGHIKDTLKYSYTKNIDYVIIKDKLTGKKGKPSETILLTPKCFKLMAMQSKTKRAIQFREYYYELEKIIEQYNEYIIKELQNKIKTLENNMK